MKRSNTITVLNVVRAYDKLAARGKMTRADLLNVILDHPKLATIRHTTRLDLCLASAIRRKYIDKELIV